MSSRDFYLFFGKYINPSCVCKQISANVTFEMFDISVRRAGFRCCRDKRYRVRMVYYGYPYCVSAISVTFTCCLNLYFCCRFINSDSQNAVLRYCCTCGTLVIYVPRNRIVKIAVSKYGCGKLPLPALWNGSVFRGNSSNRGYFLVVTAAIFPFSHTFNSIDDVLLCSPSEPTFVALRFIEKYLTPPRASSTLSATVPVR